MHGTIDDSYCDVWQWQRLTFAFESYSLENYNKKFEKNISAALL